MKSVPGAAMRQRQPAPTRVLCPGCGTLICHLPAGTRLATRASGLQPDRHLEGTCNGCGHEYSLPVVNEP